MSTTGERIRALRLRHGMTLDDVAKHLGVGRQAIYKYEQGTVTNIPLENLEKMAELFSTTPDYLAGWSDSEKPLKKLDLNLFGKEPQTSEAQILAKGIDRMPKDQREQALNIIRAVFTQYADYFNKEDNDET